MHALETGPVTYVDLLRHGAPVGGHRYRGGLDDPLSPEGWEQMWAVVPESPVWTRIVSSPLLRCAEFARALAERHGLPVEIEPRLREIGFGAWEGERVAELFEREPEVIRRYWADPVAHPPPGGEPLADCQARVVAAFEDALSHGEGQRLLFVCHGGVIRLLLTHLLGMPLAGVLRLEVPPASLSRVRVQRDVNGRRLASLVLHGGRP